MSTSSTTGDQTTTSDDNTGTETSTAVDGGNVIQLRLLVIMSLQQLHIVTTMVITMGECMTY